MPEEKRSLLTMPEVITILMDLGTSLLCTISVQHTQHQPVASD